MCSIIFNKYFCPQLHHSPALVFSQVFGLLSGENYQSGGVCAPAPRPTGWTPPLTVLRGGLPVDGMDPNSGKGGEGTKEQTTKDIIEEIITKVFEGGAEGAEAMSEDELYQPGSGWKKVVEGDKEGSNYYEEGVVHVNIPNGSNPSILNSSLLSDKTNKDGSMDMREEGWLLNTTPLQGLGGEMDPDLDSSILLSSKLELSLSEVNVEDRRSHHVYVDEEPLHYGEEDGVLSNDLEEEDKE